MADLSDSTNWSELDAGNNKTSPNGWPEGMMPSGVNDSARNDKGALKRFWDRINPVQNITPASGLWQFNTANAAYPTAYVNGEVYSFNPIGSSLSGDQFQVNALGAKPIYKRVESGGGYVPIGIQDIIENLAPLLIYNAGANAGAGAFVLQNPWLPTTSDGAGGLSVPGNITAGGNLAVTGGSGTFGGNLQAQQITATGAGNFVGFTDRTTGALWEWYADNGVAHLYQGGDWLGINAANGNLTVTGTYLYLDNSIGTVNGSGGGPFLYADPGAIAFHLGPTNNAFLFQNSSGADVATLTSAGNLTLTGSLSVNGNINTSGQFTGVSLSVSGNSALNTLSVSGGLTANAIGATSLQLNGGGSSVLNVPNGGIQVAGQSTFLQGINIGTSIDISGLSPITNTGNTWYHSASGFLTDYAVQANNAGTAFYAPNGNVVCVSLTQSSDARLKTNIADSRIGLDAILGLTPKTFRRIASPEREELGLIAQEVAAALPQAVTMNEHDERLGIDYAPITAALINAVQQLAARVATLEAK
jgi:cytoskeletal protein CcmA (bactofilin family)